MTSEFKGSTQPAFNSDSVAVMFDGQGIFGPGMGKFAHENYAASREVFKDASEATGIDMPRVCFGDLTSLLDDTRFAQPAIATVDLAEYAAWKERTETEPAVVTGLSMGMYAAMGAAGVFESYGQTVDIVARRARRMHEVAKEHPGKMAAIIGIAEAQLETILRKAGAEFAVLRDRARHNFIITGSNVQVEMVKEEAQNQGARKEDLEILMAAHSKRQRGVIKPFREDLRGIKMRAPQIPLYANTAKYLNTPAEVVREALEQLVKPADWDATIEGLVSQGIVNVIEFGPDKKRGLSRQMVKKFGTTALQFPAEA